MVIAVDFDGTYVKHAFPDIGEDIGAVPVLKELVENGNKLILYTLRADYEALDDDGEFIPDEGGRFLTEAVKWFKRHNIPLFGVQEHPRYPKSKKLVYNLIIDDRAIGIPLIEPKNEEPYVDWIKLREILIKYKIIK